MAPNCLTATCVYRATRETNVCAFPPAGIGRVEMWRGDVRLSMSVPAPFVWRCLSDSEPQSRAKVDFRVRWHYAGEGGCRLAFNCKNAAVSNAEKVHISTPRAFFRSYRSKNAAPTVPTVSTSKARSSETLRASQDVSEMRRHPWQAAPCSIRSS
jgi:hypothetical protein